MNFPACFRYPNHKTWIRIHSFDRFEEIVLIGKKYEHIEIRAEQYPEKLKIKDMLANENGWLEEVNESEFINFLEEIKKSHSLLGSV
ncbi:MAG: hypothetical protein KDC83_03745 [Flavobacteriales bacterium]|nr:hypothetical protein [Flavobacteriales bacterium]